jgi:putative peptidoglycan lipid II flippase
VENVISIAVLIASAILFGIGRDVSEITEPQLLLLGLGTAVAVAVHAGVQWFGAYRVGIALVPRFDWADPELLGLVRRGAAMAGYTALYWCGYLITLVIAGTVPGGVAALQIATSFCALPTVLIAIPLASAQLPRLATNDDGDHSHAFSAIYQDGLRLMMFGVVPAALLLTCIPGTLARAASFGAMGTAQGIALISVCLGSLGLGIIGEATYTLTTPSCYARHDTASPMWAMGLRLAIIAVGAVVVRLALDPGIGLLVGLCLSVAAANLIAGAYLSRKLLHTLRSRLSFHGSGLGSVFLVAAISVLPARLLGDWLTAEATTVYQRAALAVAVSGTAIALYLAIQFVRGAPEMRLLLPSSIDRWAGRPQPTSPPAPAQTPWRAET